ncbi:putative Glucose-6-phosphate dehydrogenase [Neospora caninum Liverpool]|uniref:glucose-6-phosphate dehydrogenase (NADP(+)) n=1 Tax=Neospora caninum (strain Liverpool) TaxID=572307 RepID=F0V7A9_NEOCL|nr:putative Glucose-6-phosphate dehydrogenase [Neospora caninum Liverpool]CBZ49600.1 putative Glucose-6-phosphate dehydrogenase [Neospora caninum Liverpool]|eukprot:XP_003879635.1 putative Glucose-6-phosphate dehydrogenase [Neospora caninum Liverpool]
MVQHRIKACAAYLRHLWLLAAMTAASVLVTNVAAGTAGRDRTSGYVNVGSGSDNVTFVFYGATGDLCRRKLYPTVFQLFLENKLPEAFFIVGMSNQDMSLADFRKMHRPQLEKVWSSSKQSVDPARGNLLKQFEGRMSYTSGSIDDDNVLRPFCHKISKMELLRAPNSRWGRLLYLALPPHIFAVAAAGFKRNCSAHETNEGLLILLLQIYRIDHYLGKEMLLALPPLRFTNTFLEPLLNRNYVKEIVISFNEDIGISGRGEFFDAYGIIRDVMQNHLLQLLTLVVMERPATLSDEDIRDEKVKVLKQIDPISLAETVVGQYAKSEDGSVASYLEAGKGMGKKTVYVRIKFAGVPGFRGSTYDYRGDSLILEIQPHPSVRFEINAKAPGAGLTLERDSLKMDVTTDGVRIPDAYENLLSNVLRGDKSQFVRTDELRESWRIFTPMLHQLEEQQIQPRLYAFGSPGPSGAMHELREHKATQHLLVHA